MTEASFVWTKTFQEGFKTFSEKTGKELPDIMLEVMRVLVETAYHWTAPPTKGNRGAQGGRPGGLAAVSGDIDGVMSEVSQRFLEVLYKRFGTGPFTATMNRKNDGTPYTMTNVRLSISGDYGVLSSHHQSMRGPGGRTPKRMRREFSFSNRLLVPEVARASYKKDVQKRVGKMKAGWEHALRAVNSPRLPAGWVKKAGAISGASGMATGDFADRVAGWQGYMEAVNDTPYMRDKDGFMRRAHEYVDKFIAGPRFEKWLDSMIKKHGGAT